MMSENIPLRAKVECVDGACGESVAIILNPITRQVTHIVVQDRRFPDGRQVPLSAIAGTAAGLIRLNCAVADLEAMPAFTEIHYVKSEVPVYLPGAPGLAGEMAGYPAYANPIVLPAGTEVPEEVELLPQGEQALHRGMRVEATDGGVGEVGELLVDPGSGTITHIVLREGHVWGKRDITLPLSAIDHIEPGAVHLKLDKQSIESLPALPIKRPSRLATYGKDVEMIAYIFEDVGKADEMLDFLKELHRDKRLKILSAAVLVKQLDGKTSVKEVGDMKVGGGAVRGAVLGGALALLGPIGLVAGLVGGAAIGGLAAGLHDGGFKTKFLDRAQQQLKPGTSALLVVVEHDWANTLSQMMAGQPGVMLQTTLTDEWVNQIMASSGSR